MRSALRRLTPRLRAAARALRGFLAGFTGMPSARLAAGGPQGAGDAAAVERSLAERAARRQSCC